MVNVALISSFDPCEKIDQVHSCYMKNRMNIVEIICSGDPKSVGNVKQPSSLAGG